MQMTRVVCISKKMFFLARETYLTKTNNGIILIVDREESLLQIRIDVKFVVEAISKGKRW